MVVTVTGTREPKSYMEMWQERYGPSDFVPIGSLLDILKTNHREISSGATDPEASDRNWAAAVRLRGEVTLIFKIERRISVASTSYGSTI